MLVPKNCGYHGVRSYKTCNDLSPDTINDYSIRLGGPQGRSGWVRRISPPPLEFDPRTVQLVASHYTD